MRITKLLLGIILFFITSISSAHVIFKNTGWSKVYVAICYFDKGAWTTKGWYPVGPNELKSLYNYNMFGNPNFYNCARIENCDMGYSVNTSLYVDVQNNFTIPNACKDANYISHFINTSLSKST